MVQHSNDIDRWGENNEIVQRYEPDKVHRWQRIIAIDTGNTMYQCRRCGAWRLKGEPSDKCKGER